MLPFRAAAFLGAFLALSAGAQSGLPDDKGKDLVVKVCTGCHSATVFSGHEGSLEHWQSTIDLMIARGAKGSDAEFEQIAQYLARHFGYVPRSSDLPDGPGKKLVETICGPCHGVELLSGRHGTPESWAATVNNMVRRGAKGSDAEFEQIIAYLSEHFGPGSEKINVNTATASELEERLEISSGDAEIILRYRKEHGSFREWRELTRLPGIAAEKIERKKDWLIFE
jgi:competence protein ComEA